MPTDATPQRSSQNLWLTLLTQHLGIAVSGAAFGLIALRVLGVAKFDAVTALAIVQAGGAGNVAIGSFVASVPSIGAIVMTLTATILAHELAESFRLTPSVIMKILVFASLALFVIWWSALFTTILFALLILILTLMKKHHRKTMSKLHAADSALTDLSTEIQHFNVEVQQNQLKHRRLQAQVEWYQSQGRTSHADGERLRSKMLDLEADVERTKARNQELTSKIEESKKTMEWLNSIRIGWIRSKLALLKSKFRKPDPISPEDDEQQPAPEARPLTSRPEVPERLPDTQYLNSATWAYIVLWTAMLVPQMILMATIGWLPTETVTTKHDPPFAAYILSESDEELVLLRRDHGSVQRLPTTDLIDHRICRTSSGVWAKSTIALTTSTPKYPSCPEGSDNW